MLQNFVCCSHWVVLNTDYSSYVYPARWMSHHAMWRQKLTRASLLPSWALPFPLPSLFPSPSLHVFMACLYFSTPPPFLCLYYPLNFLPHFLNKLCSILYHHMASPSAGRDTSAWACRDIPIPHTSLHAHSCLHPHRTYSISFYRFINTSQLACLHNWQIFH